MTLDGKNVLITGAKGALGHVVTRSFLAAGARVAGVSRSISPADFPHEQFTAISADAGNAAGAKQAVDAAVKAFGRLDAVIHLVGGFASGPTVEATTDEEIDKMLDMNLRAAWNMARAAMPVFRAQGSGRFAAIASAIVDHPAAGTSAYAVSKAAVWALIRTLDAEGEAAGIRARVLTPPTLDDAIMQSVAKDLVEFTSS